MRDEAITRSFALRLGCALCRRWAAWRSLSRGCRPNEDGRHTIGTWWRHRRLIANGLARFRRSSRLSRARLGRWSRQLVAL